MLKKMLVVAAMTAISTSVLAVDANLVAQSIPLKDGSTVYIFKDGKMAQESRFGRAVYLNVGASVSTKDGRNIAITSNEVARLGSLLQKEHGG